MKATAEKINQAVAPGGSIDVKVNFKNPEKAGNYLALFRLNHGNNIEFGDKAVADICVNEVPIISKAVEEHKPVNEHVA